MKYISYSLFLLLVPVSIQSMRQDRITIPIEIVNQTGGFSQWMERSIDIPTTLAEVARQMQYSDRSMKIVKMRAGNVEIPLSELSKFSIQKNLASPHIPDLINKTGVVINNFTNNKPLRIYYRKDSR